MGYSPWGCKESDTTECLAHTHTHVQLLEKKKKRGFSLLFLCINISQKYHIKKSKEQNSMCSRLYFEKREKAEFVFIFVLFTYINSRKNVRYP